MKVTIIIPIYNVADYIVDCVQSVVNQDYTEEFECILINDCTPDNSMELLADMLEVYRGPIKFKIVNREKNGGLSAARNSGIKAASGDYLYFLDSDDTITPDCVNSLLSIAEKYPKAEIVQSGACATIGNRYDFLKVNEKKDLPEYSDDRVWIKSTMLKRFVLPMTVWNKLIRRDFLLANNLFFKEGLIHEDEHWNYFASKYVTALAICKQITYIYRIRENSIVNSLKKEKSWQSISIILSEFMANIDPLCRKDQVRLIFEMCYDMYLQVDTDVFKQVYRKLLIKIGKKLNPFGWILVCAMLACPRSFLIRPFVIRQINVRLLTVALLGV